MTQLSFDLENKENLQKVADVLSSLLKLSLELNKEADECTELGRKTEKRLVALRMRRELNQLPSM